MRIYVFFHIKKKIGLTFGAIIKKHIFPVRAHVNFPSTNRYNSLTCGTISIYFDPADTSLSQLQLCPFLFFLLVLLVKEGETELTITSSWVEAQTNNENGHHFTSNRIKK